nr:hypothetical protein [Tanacetum cinerariifolium]
ERLKGRLVVKEFNQKEGVDYKYTFSPIAKLATIRVLIALTTAKGWPFHQLDVNNAFLHGYIDEEIYMLSPERNNSTHFMTFLVYVDILRKYILDLLKDNGLTAYKPNPSPLPTSLHLSLDKGIPLTDDGAYRRLVGILLYLTMTRPDISYLGQHLSEFVSAPKDTHINAALYLLRSLNGTISKGLFYPV